MADIFSKEQRSSIMSHIRAKNTTPEMIVRRYLFSKGFRFRVHQKGLPGTPDIVLKKYRTVIIVNGCFWHGHQPCTIFKMPKSRIEFWTNKIERNRERDSTDIKALKQLGWYVITVWECQLKSKVREGSLNKLSGKISNQIQL